MGVEERLGDGDRGEALPAADVGDARVPCGLQAGDDVGHRSEPLGGELAGERRTVDVALAVTKVPTVGVIGHAGARSVGVDQPRQHAADARQEVREGRHVRGIVGVVRGRVRGRG